MKLSNMFLVLSVIISIPSAFAMDKVIYGDDNRIDVYESTNPLYTTLAVSTAARVPKMNLEATDDYFVFKADTLIDRGFCEEDAFNYQIAAGDCSGFLVGDDLLVTAGHCMRSSFDCEDNAWVFDYQADRSTGNIEFVQKSSVYNCAEIIEQKLDPITKDDYALIRLDRVAEYRWPLQYRKEGKIEDNESLVIIGNPIGLPTKIADNANVRHNDNDFYFVANLDSFGGNSGSAVFNAETGVVEGILVRGENDFNYDYENQCYRINYCDDDKCRGEDVTRITNIEYLKNL